MTPRAMQLICGRSREGTKGHYVTEFSSQTFLCPRPGELGQGHRWREKGSGPGLSQAPTTCSALILLCDLQALAPSDPL